MFKIASPHKIKYLKNASWVFSGFVLRFVLNLVVSVLLARYLQPEGFGILNYATTMMFIFTPIAFLGMYGIVTRELVNHNIEENKILGTAFVLKAISSVSTLLIILVLIQFTESAGTTKWQIMIVSFSFLASPFGVIDFYFQSKLQSKFAVLSQQISYTITSLLRLLLIYMQAPLMAFIYVFLLEIVLNNAFLLIFYIRQGFRLSLWAFDKKVAFIFLKECPKIVLAEFFGFVYLRIDQIMIEKMLGYKQLGIYTSAVKLCEPFYLFATVITASFFPAIINGMKISETEYKSRLQRLFNILTWSAIVVSLFIQFTSEYIIKILYNDKYDGASPILAMYFWTSIFIFQSILASQAYMIEKKQQFTAIQTFTGAILNIIFNLILIPRYQLLGACYASLISYFFSAVVLNAFHKSTRGVFFMQINAYRAIFIKPKALIQQFYINKSNEL